MKTTAFLVILIKSMKRRGIECVTFKGSAKEAAERIAGEALRR
jgi:hypothetical protein